MEASEQERNRLEIEGVTFDAAPRSSSGAASWVLFGTGLLTVGLFFWWKQRRAAS